MAQLPPKIPNLVPTWPDIMFSGHHQKLPVPSLFSASGGGCDGGGGQSPSWVDEFLDFSAARRGAHRRSASDSIAFLESGPTIHGPSGPRSNGDRGDFDRFDDDEQFLSMFTDEISPLGPTISSSNPSTPSDHNSIINDDKQPPVQEKEPPVVVKSGNETEEVQSPCNSSEAGAAGTSVAGGNDSSERISDPKRVKRILANRQSAQRSRVRKLQYISELERSVTSLQAEVSILSPRVAFLDHQRLLLNVDNSALKQRIAALAQDKIFKDAHQEALKREIERLWQVHHQQNLKKNMENNTNTNNASGNLSTLPPPSSDPKPAMEKEQLLAT